MTEVFHEDRHPHDTSLYPEEEEGIIHQRGVFEVMDVAKHFIPNYEQLHQLRQELEGPKPLRVIAGLGGLALAATSLFGLLNIFAMLIHPSRLLLQIYEAMFGLLVAIVELKSMFKTQNKLQEFCYKWFPFLSIVGGKGAFYVFAGSLGFVLGWIVLIPALVVFGMGIVYIMFHFGKCGELREKYEQSVVLASNEL